MMYAQLINMAFFFLGHPQILSTTMLNNMAFVYDSIDDWLWFLS